MPSEAQSLDSGHTDVIHDVQMDYYGKRLATCSSDCSIKIFSVTGGSHTQLAHLAGHSGPVWQVAWSHPKFGSLLASCSYDKHVIIWRESPENVWTLVQDFQHHASSVNSISWAPYQLGLILACASSDGSLSLLTHQSDGTWGVERIPQAHPVGATSVSWAPAPPPGSLVAAAMAGQPDGQVSGHAGQAQAAQFAPVRQLVSGGCDSAVKIWRLVGQQGLGQGGQGQDTGRVSAELTAVLKNHREWVRDVAWAPNLGLAKSTIASASQDGTVVIWSLALSPGSIGAGSGNSDEWRPVVLANFDTPVWRVSWSVTGNILAVSDANNHVSLWKETSDGKWAEVTTMQSS